MKSRSAFRKLPFVGNNRSTSHATTNHPKSSRSSNTESIPREGQAASSTREFSHRGSRHEACRVLGEARIPFMIWCEDALAAHGIPTVAFDMFLLVADPIEAKRALENGGWKSTDPNQRYRNVPELGSKGHRLVPRGFHPTEEPDPGDLARSDGSEQISVVLLRSSSWGHDPLSRYPECVVPPLGAMLNCLFTTYLNTNHETFMEMLATHIIYIYEYSEAVKSIEIENDIAPENRQLHLDMKGPRQQNRSYLISPQVRDLHRTDRDHFLTYNTGEKGAHQ